MLKVNKGYKIINCKDRNGINLPSVKYIEDSVYQKFRMKMTWAYKLDHRQ